MVDNEIADQGYGRPQGRVDRLNRLQFVLPIRGTTCTGVIGRTQWSASAPHRPDEHRADRHYMRVMSLDRGTAMLRGSQWTRWQAQTKPQVEDWRCPIFTHSRRRLGELAEGHIRSAVNFEDRARRWSGLPSTSSTTENDLYSRRTISYGTHLAVTQCTPRHFSDP